MSLWPRRPALPSALRLPQRPTLVVNAVLVLLLALGVFLSYRTVAVADTAPTTRSTSRTVPVTQGQVISSVSASGSIESASTAAANFVTSGTVTEIDVKVGDTVKTGQVLAKVNPTAAQEQLTAARANLTSAQQSLSRAQSATQPDAATIAAAQAQVTNAQNSVNSAQRALDGTTLTAPMDGTVVAVNGTVGGSSGGSASSGGGSGAGPSGGNGSGSAGGGNGGNNAGGNGSGGGSSTSTSGSSSATTGGFIRIADLGKMQVSASFAEADATKLKLDQAATVTWAALSGARATGKVSAISPTATTQNGVNSYAVTVGLDSLPDGVRIGQTVTVTVTVAQVDNAVRVPVAAVRGAGQRHTVDVVTANGQHETRPVQVGVQGDQFDEITSGLQPGEQVALNLQTGTGTTTNGRFGGGGLGGGGFGGGGNRGGAGFGGGGFTGGGGAGNRGGGTRGGAGG